MKKQIVFLLAAVTLVSCGKTTDSQKNEQERTEVVAVMTLHAQPTERVLTLSSNLQGYETVNIAPSLTGRIEHIYVEVGDKMHKGDTLVRMDQTQYKQTKYSMATLEIQMQRMEALIQSGAVSQQNYDQTKLQYDQNKENLAFLQTNTYVQAPFNGVIAAKAYEDGELYSGQPIVVITQTDRLKTLISVPESYIPYIKQGQKLTIHTDIYPDQDFPAFIEVVYPTVDASSHTFQCKVQIPNKNGLLRPGMYVSTTLGLGKENMILVPYQSVEKLVGSNERYVFINNAGRAKRVAVTLGQRVGQDVEILSPELTEGVEYIYLGQHKLVDGTKLELAADSHHEQ